VGELKRPVQTFDYSYVNRLVKVEWVKNLTDNANLAHAMMSGTATQGVVNQGAEQNDSLTITGLSVGTVVCDILKEGAERFLITDINAPSGSSIAQSAIPVMWDCTKNRGNYSYQQPGLILFNHVPSGAGVLYMDGHVSFVKYPAEMTQATWPITKTSLDKQPPPAGVPYTDPASGYW
jgi:prepilin-type processing-associated H-X9-DG protein